MPQPEPRLTRTRVVDAAAELLDAQGSLTLAALARRLGVRTPSLYHHVDGLDDLTGALRDAGLERLGDAVLRASSGRAGRAALDAVARAYVAFGRDHPGSYALTLAGTPASADGAGGAREEPAAARLLDTVRSVLRGYGLEGDAALHATRVLRSALHGFVSLRAAGGFALALDPDATLEVLVDALDAGLVRLAGERR